MKWLLPSLSFCAALGLAAGCHHKPHITAVSLAPESFGCETGIPFYLPKPLLIISKNFRSIETTTTGLTDSAPIPSSFDDQAKYADVNARTNFNFGGNNSTGGATQTGNPDAATSTAEKSAPHVQTTDGPPITPATSPSDGLAPDTFFTYHIVFVPDLSQKFGLKIRGGPGEIRAAMNLVNGWQFTGLGPYYMKDSSTAQNILSAGIATRLGGQAVSDVVKSLADLADAGQTQSGGIDASDPRIQQLSRSLDSLPAGCVPMTLCNYAQIHVYEPNLMMDGTMAWTPVTELCFDRQYLGQAVTNAKLAAPPANVTIQSGNIPAGANDPNANMARAAVAQVLGLSPDSLALQGPGGELQSGTLQSGTGATATPGGVQQVQVDCGDECEPTVRKEFNLFKLGGHTAHRKRGHVQTGIARIGGGTTLTAPMATRGLTSPGTPPTSGGGIQSGSVPDGEQPPPQVIFNQPFLNRPVINRAPAEVVPAPPADMPAGGAGAGTVPAEPVPADPAPAGGGEILPPATGGGGIQ